MALLVFWCLDIQDIQSAFLTPQFSCIGKHIGSEALRMKNYSKIIGFPISANNAITEKICVFIALIAVVTGLVICRKAFFLFPIFFVFSDQSDRDSLFLIL